MRTLEAAIYLTVRFASSSLDDGWVVVIFNEFLAFPLEVGEERALYDGEAATNTLTCLQRCKPVNCVDFYCAKSWVFLNVFY